MRISAKSLLLVFVLAIFSVTSAVISTESTNQNQGNSDHTQTPNSLAVEVSANSDESKYGLNMTWKEYKKQFGKNYLGGGQDIDKQTNFKLNLKKLQNSDCNPCGVNSLFDKSQEQLDHLLGTLPGKGDPSKNNITIFPAYPQSLSQAGASLESNTPDSILSAGQITATPKSFDWRTYKAVTSPKDQADCGSCWAFSATGFLESEYIRRGMADDTLDLAEHYLYQCDKTSSKCDGGYPFNAAALGVKTGMPLESTYPYRIGYSYSSTICSKPKVYAKFADSGNVTYYSKTKKVKDSTLISLLLQRPIMIGVDADDFQKYAPTSKNKILSCGTSNSNGNSINHAVLLVGYTAKSWIVKNSWGTEWGLEGYIQVTRNSTRSCNIGNYYGTFTQKLTPVV